jgi:hypothetical protein|tara:strand:+ start:1348 stop:1755 length:408 start_codon:yes stop_codon:yes gene_type:complete
MTTQRKRTIKNTGAVIDHDGHDVIEEVTVEEVVVEQNIPQLYQSTVTIRKGGPEQPTTVIGHIEFSDTTGKLRAIPNAAASYGVDLEVVVSGGLISKTDSSVVFSPRTKDWLLNIHNGVLPRNWVATEAWNRDEV